MSFNRWWNPYVSESFYMWSVHVICSGDLYFKSYETVIMGEKTRFPGSQSSFRNFKSIVKMVLLSICLSPSISGNINLGSWYHGSMDHIIKVSFLIATETSPLIHSCHFWNIIKVSPKSISVSSIESKDEINKLTLFKYSFLMPKQSNWETTRSDIDCPRISETDKMIISWHW